MFTQTKWYNLLLSTISIVKHLFRFFFFFFLTQWNNFAFSSKKIRSKELFNKRIKYNNKNNVRYIFFLPCNEMKVICNFHKRILMNFILNSPLLDFISFLFSTNLFFFLSSVFCLLYNFYWKKSYYILMLTKRVDEII